MIQFLSDNVDQLDLALDQLAVLDRNFDRFALMLIDNVVELTLHKYVEDKARENDLWGRFDTPKHDPKIIEKALGQNFDAKVKAAVKLGLIDNDAGESILNLHSFRNTAYHKGLRHEKILHSLAVFYFRCACSLLKAYEPKWWSWGSSDRISHRAMKYLGKNTFGAGEERFLAAYERLDEVVVTMGGDLVVDLASDMDGIIESIDDAISFLADEGRENTRDQVVIYSQAWGFAFTDEAKGFAKNSGCTETCVGPYVDWIAANYNWSVKRDPIPSWRSRHESLLSEGNPHKALKKYCDFMRQTEAIRSTLMKSAMQLEQHLQSQIDIARGK
jgi:hypothetical protein